MAIVSYVHDMKNFYVNTKGKKNTYKFVEVITSGIKLTNQANLALNSENDEMVE